jgi:uncharacterized protein YacL
MKEFRKTLVRYAALPNAIIFALNFVVNKVLRSQNKTVLSINKVYGFRMKFSWRNVVKS